MPYHHTVQGWGNHIHESWLKNIYIWGNDPIQKHPTTKKGVHEIIYAYFYNQLTEIWAILFPFHLFQ